MNDKSKAKRLKSFSVKGAVGLLILAAALIIAYVGFSSPSTALALSDLSLDYWPVFLIVRIAIYFAVGYYVFKYIQSKAGNEAALKFKSILIKLVVLYEIFVIVGLTLKSIG